MKFFKSKNNNINHDMIEDSDCSYNLMRDNDINKKIFRLLEFMLTPSIKEQIC